MQKVVHINQKGGKCALLDGKEDEIKIPIHDESMQKTKTGR